MSFDDDRCFLKNYYESDGWRIKAFVTKKNPHRNNAFSFELIDREKTMIKASCFNKYAEKFANIIQKDKWYIISGGKVQLTNKRFTSIANDYCLTLDDSTTIKETKQETKMLGFSFKNLTEIERLHKCTVDVIGVIIKVYGIESISV